MIVVGLLSLLAYFHYVSGECANACNGHGKCTSYDMCICNRNWQASDCSERVCMFGLAHVDTPKGDLDASGSVTNANKVVIENSFVYPYGTTEQFPQMQDSDLHTLTDTAHYYMECSNKGKCDRSTGECQCFDGYDGVACQRASCPGYPNSCSGHGVCKTIKQLAGSDSGNVYELWDKDATMGCECDKGYFGPDCSQRECKYGVDPLYLDDAATVKYSIFDVATLTTAATSTFTDGESDVKPGYWAIRFFDIHGEDWVTQPIVAGSDCDDVVTVLETLPNNVVPSGSVECTKTSFVNGVENTFSLSNYYTDAQNSNYRLTYKLALWEARTSALYGELSPATPLQNYTGSNDTSTIHLSGHIYRLKFYGNPGKIPQPEVEIYLDGKRPTLVSPNSKVITKVWTDGQQGENNDYFADHCDGVTTTIGVHGNADFARDTFLSGFTIAEKNLLKACLGSSDFDDSNNQDVYNWDKGSKYYPHIIKLVRTVTTYTDGGYYAVVYYDTTQTLDNTGYEGTFRLLNPFYPPDAFATDNYDVYTTSGVLALTSLQSEATFSFASKYIFTVNTTYDINRNASAVTSHFYDGDISCEFNSNSPYVYHCLNKTDIFTFLNWEYPELNPPHINLYTATRLWTGPFEYSTYQRFINPTQQMNTEMHYMTHMITSDLSTNWGVSVGNRNPNVGVIGNPHFHIYKFFPNVKSTYEYVAECSNRGICDRDSGVCKCFPGYTSDSCNEQSSLSL